MPQLIKPNGRGIVAMMKEPGIANDMRRRAENVAAAARASAPVDTGAYQASIHVEMETHPARAAAHVVASDWKAHILEARLGILARALDAAR
jgi:hypothetical protein